MHFCTKVKTCNAAGRAVAGQWPLLYLAHLLLPGWIPCLAGGQHNSHLHKIFNALLTTYLISAAFYWKEERE